MYSSEQLASLLGDLGIQIQSETATQYLCYCPFHDNTDSPAFAISKENGAWLCFNYSCDKKGSLRTLVGLLSDKPMPNIARFIAGIAQEKALESNAVSMLADIFGEVIEKNNWREEMLDAMAVDYSNPDDVSRLSYLLGRGFREATLKTFEIGYSSRKQRIVIPVRNESFRLVGVIGRGISDEQRPKYLYSDNLPKRSILYNMCHAKSYNEVVIVEGSLDAMKVHQAGYPNVVAVLGCNLSDEQALLINKYFNAVTIFADNDEAGQKGLATSIIDKCSRREIYFARYETDGPTDPGGMTELEIQTAITQRESELERLCSTWWEKK